MKKFIIHTNSYAGNFEREMCAFITGQIGECSVGHKLVDNEISDKFHQYICQVDDDGCKRPVTIYPNPKYSNNGLGHIFDKTNIEECKIVQQKYVDYIKNDRLKRLYNTLAFYEGTKYNVSSIEEEIISVEKEIANYLTIPPMEISTYPAYNSVCIYVTDNIPDNLVELMKERAYLYPEKCKEDIIIEGFELLTDEVKENEVIESMSIPKVIDYNEVVFHPWLEFNDCGGNFTISMSFHDSYSYDVDELTEFINIPDGCIIKDNEFVKIKISEEYRKKICEKIYQIFGLKYIEPVYNDEIEKLFGKFHRNYYSKHVINIKIKSIGLMNFLNRFFEIGFTNNIMNPDKSYWRLAYDATLENYLKKLDEF
jgi:hypothetical protein